MRILIHPDTLTAALAARHSHEVQVELLIHREEAIELHVRGDEERLRLFGRRFGAQLPDHSGGCWGR